MIPAMRLLDRYDAYMHRRLAARHGEDHAYREARAQARLAIAVVIGTALTGLAVLADVAGQPDIALALRLLFLAWGPVVIVAVLRARRAHSN